MKIRIWLIGFYVALALQTGFAETDSRLLPTGHWIYDACMYLSIETGQATMAVQEPMTYSELTLYLDAISYSSLSENGQSLYSRIFLVLGNSDGFWQRGEASIAINPVVSVTGKALPAEDRGFEFEKIKRFNETLPFLSIPISIKFSPYLAAFADFTVGQGFWASESPGNFSNVPLTGDSFDMNVPSRAWVSSGNSFFSASIGRGSLNQGRTLTGSMILSNTADRLDYVSLVFFLPRLRISFTPIELSPEKYIYFHDISIQPFRSLVLRFSEAASVHSTLDMRYLNPAMIYHNYAGWRDTYPGSPEKSNVGTQFAFAADFVPGPGFRVYGQFVMNQFQTSYELENFSDSTVIPNSLGGLAGIEIVRPYKKGYLTGTIEGVYTNPWLYILEDHGISFYWSRKELVAPAGKPDIPIQLWLGTPFGPDTIAAAARLLYDVPSVYSLSCEYTFLCRGTNGDDFFDAADDDYYPASLDEAQKSTPSSGAVYSHDMEFSLSYFLSDVFEISGMLGFSVLLSPNILSSTSARASCTVTVYIPGTWKKIIE